MMNTKPFIIALTGASASGKSFIIDKITEIAHGFNDSKRCFVPVPFPKFTTREYRANEIKKLHSGEFVDVKSVDELPSECDLIYRTYGKDYGLRTKDLKEKLDSGESPVVVINDVRAVEELKQCFKGRVLSLFLFRHVPDFEEIKRETSSRGNVSERELLDRYIKATALYRIYIENITVFDRVILNVKDENEDVHKCTKLQISNVLNGIFENRIFLSKERCGGPKLFIISGNNASGKDDVNRAVQRMGKLQAAIIPKYTSRRQEDDDENEMICQYIPRIDLMREYKIEYEHEKKTIEDKYSKSIPSAFIECCRTTYNVDLNETFEDYCNVQWDISRLKALRDLPKAAQRFWRDQKDSETFFQNNDKYINLHELQVRSRPYNPKRNEELCYLARYEEDEYIIYENHGKQIKYAFTVDGLRYRMSSDLKHRVLVASFVNLFEYCRRIVGEAEVVPIFSYSQISKEHYDKEAEGELQRLKSQSYDDLIRYSENIVDFEHVIIYAETEMQKQTAKFKRSGGQKEDLIDQMFRLFRAYTNCIFCN